MGSNLEVPEFEEIKIAISSLRNILCNESECDDISGCNLCMFEKSNSEPEFLEWMFQNLNAYPVVGNIPKEVPSHTEPSYYKDMQIDPLTFIEKNNLPFIDGNIIKYVSRFRKKGGLKDLHKAQHYLNMLIKKEEG